MSIKYNKNLVGIGNELGIKYSNVLSNFRLFTRNSDFAFWIDKASGQSFPTLAERTLPNGVKNGIHTKNVSDDKSLLLANVSSISTAGLNSNIVSTVSNLYADRSSWTDTVNGKIIFGNYTQIADVTTDDVFLVGTFATRSDGRLKIGVPKTITTVSAAYDYLKDIILRYQLATPVDTLNSPQVNPVQDLVGVVGKNLVDIFALGNAFVNTVYVGNKFRFNALSGTATTTPYFKNRDFKPNTQYTISGIWSQPAANNYKFKFVYTDATTENQSANPPASPTAFSFTSSMGKTIDYIAIVYSTTVGGNYTEVENMQLEESAVATAYEPYGKSNGLLQGFGFIPTSGYADVPIKGVGDEISYSNLVTNGDFANGTTGWSGEGVSNLSNASGKLRIDKGTLIRAKTDLSMLANKRYFLKIGSITTDMTDFYVYLNTGFTRLDNVGFKAILTTTLAGTYLILGREVFNDGTYAELDNIQLINLTDNPQVQALESKLGRQLTVAECDYLFDFTATTNTIKAKVVTGIQGDGVNDVILLPSNAPNPVGTQDFGFAFVFKTGASLSTMYLYSRTETGYSGSQVSFYISSGGAVNVVLTGGVDVTLATGLQINTIYSLIVKRKSGRLYSFLNKVPVVNVPNTTVLVEKPNARMFATTSNAGGTTHSGFFNGIGLYDNYNNGDNIDAWEADQNKAIAKIYGL